MNCFVEFDTNAENFADIISASRDSVVNVTNINKIFWPEASSPTSLGVSITLFLLG